MDTDKDNTIEERIEAVSTSNKKLLKKSNQIDYVLFGGMTAVHVTLAIAAGLVGSWDTIFFLVGSSIWVLLVLGLNIQLNNQHYVINMLHDLRRIERTEIQRVLDDLEEASKEGELFAVKKEVKA